MSCRVADGELTGVFGVDEEAVAGGLRMHVAIAGAKSRDGLELVRCSVVEGDDVYGTAGVAGAVVAVDEGEAGLARVVGEEEVEGEGGVAPGGADGAAAEDSFGGQADEDLPDDDLVRDAAVERRRS